MENMNSKSQRINKTILHERSTLSADFNVSIPSALNTVGLTEEEDRVNTRRVRQLLENFRHNQNVSTQNGTDSILTEADAILNPPQSSNHVDHTTLFDSTICSQHSSSSNTGDLSLSPLHIKTPSPSLSSTTIPSPSSSSITTPPVLSSPIQSSSSTKRQSPLPMHIKSPSPSPSPTPSPVIKHILPHLSSNTPSPTKESSSDSMDNSSISPSPVKEIGIPPSSLLNKVSSSHIPVKNLSVSHLLSSFSPKRKMPLSTSFSPVKEQSPSSIQGQSPSSVKKSSLSPSSSITDQSPSPVRKPSLSPSSSIQEQSPSPIRKPYLSPSPSPSKESSSFSTPPPVRKSCLFVSLSPSSPSKQSSYISISSSPHPSHLPTSLNRQSDEMIIENSFSASQSDSSSIIISDKESSSLSNEHESDSSTQVTSYSQTHQPSSQKLSSQKLSSQKSSSKLSSKYDEIMLLSSSSTSSSDEEPITYHHHHHAKEDDNNDDPEDDDYIPTGKLATEVITPKPLNPSRSVKKKRPLSSDSQVISISSSSSSDSEGSPDPILSQLLNNHASSPVSIHSDSDSDGLTHPHPHHPSFSQPTSQQQVIDDFDGFISSYVKDCSHTFHSQQQPSPLQPSSSLDYTPSTTPSHPPTQPTTTWSDFSSQQEISASKTRVFIYSFSSF